MAKQKQNHGPELIKTWSIPTSLTLGSSVRAKGILQEIRARLPSAIRKSMELDGVTLTLAMPQTSRAVFRATSAAVTEMLPEFENLPVIPREIEDILTISTTERRRWLEDGRLPSAGTRTVRLAGRARQITFHVFDPAVVMELLDRGAADEWREEDRAAAAENRRRSAMKAKLTRSLKNRPSTPPSPDDGTDEHATRLRGWDEFGSDGLLR